MCHANHDNLQEQLQSECIWTVVIFVFYVFNMWISSNLIRAIKVKNAEDEPNESLSFSEEQDQSITESADYKKSLFTGDWKKFNEEQETQIGDDSTNQTVRLEGAGMDENQSELSGSFREASKKKY